MAKRKSPRSASAGELKKFGVTVIDEYRFWLMCDACTDWWSPMIPGDGKRLHRGYWHCPQGCNRPE